MKKILSILALFAFVATAVIYAYAEDKIEVRSETNPQYEITVYQKGEEMGKIVLELWPDVAPKHVANFDKLVDDKVYDSTAFHRVIPGFMIQGGDPNSKSGPKSTWGYGDPSFDKVPAEFSNESHKRGIVSMARSQDPNSASTQFFICVADASFLNGKYSVFGQVLSGMDVADKVVNSPRDKKDNPNDKIMMIVTKLK
jgi:peptidyl-prolyl cis-trans isomerase B (cyclophilin B)